jgi:hypothetical protein
MNWKAIIALVVLLAGALIAWATLRGRDTKPIQADETMQRVFPGLRTDDLKTLNLIWRDAAGTETTVTFNRAETGWSVSSGKLTDVGDVAHVRKLVEAFVKVRQGRAVTAEASADYGIAPAEVELRATLADGRERAVLIGKVAWQENLRYLQVAGETQVRIVPDALYGHARHPLEWFRSHRVLTITPFEAQKISITTPAGTIEVTGRDGAWTQSVPVPDDADSELVQDFLRRLYVDAQARRFIDQVSPAERAAYGVDSPFLDVTVTGERGATCRVRYSEGKGVHNGTLVPTLYALREGRLFDCGPDHLERLRVNDLMFFRSTPLTATDSKQLNLLQVTPPGGTTWSVVREGHKWSIAQPRRVSVEGTTVRLLPDIVGELDAARFFDSATPADFARFGVDATNGTVVNLADSMGRHETLVIGELVPDTKGTLRYVRLGDSNRVRAMSARRADFLTGAGRGWLFFLDKQLWGVTTPTVTNVKIEIREAQSVVFGEWSMVLNAGAPTFTAKPGSTPHASRQSNAALKDAISSLSTLRARHWVNDGHANLARYGLSEAAGDDGAGDDWRVRVTLTVNQGDGPVQRMLLLGNDVQWPSFGGKPLPEVYARTGKGHAISGDLIFTVTPNVLEGLRKIVK